LGRKVHPIGFRLGIVKDHQACWYAEGREYAALLREDRAIRQLIRRENERAGISTIEIERLPFPTGIIGAEVARSMSRARISGSSPGWVAR